MVSKNKGKDGEGRDRRSGSEKRLRTRLLIIRVTAEEKQAIDAIRERTGLSVAALVRNALLKTPPPRASRRPSVDVKAVARLLGQLGKIGGNINQLAKQVNMGNFSAQVQEGIRYQLRDLAELRLPILQALGFEKGYDPEADADES